MTHYHIFDVDADPASGAWAGAPVDSGETTAIADWNKMFDHADTHFDTHEAWLVDGAITTIYPGGADAQKSFTVAMRVNFFA